MLMPALACAEDQHKPAVKEHLASIDSMGVESLSPALRALLAEEMLAIQSGMQAIIPAYAAGNWGEIASIADKIKNSYILKQKLTDDQKEELHSSLPASFIQLDQQFHYFAGMLKHVAEEEKSELVGFYFSKMNDACHACHSQYATHKFPAFEQKGHVKEHSHE